MITPLITPRYTVDVDDRYLTLHLDQLPMALKSKLRPVITKLTNELLGRVRSMEPRHTGLLQSLTRSYVDETEDYVRGRVRILAPSGQAHNIAAAALEYGAHKLFIVSAYRRRTIAVRAYERHARIAARRFLRDPAAAMRERALGEIRAAVDEAIQSVQ
jgi:hypothetical protein